MIRKSRNTKQKEVIEQILSSMNSFFTAEDIYKLVKKKDNQIGIATVYRFLNGLKKENKLYSYICDRKTLYSKEKKSHCHFTCEKTGKIIHFDIDNIDFLKKVKEKIPGSITSFQLEVRGVCEKCNLE
jgi:Fur family ferric uptake transcriptional regulator